MTIRRREGDPDQDDSYKHRYDPMELRLGFNGKSIQARGMVVVVVIVLLGAIASVWALDHYQTALMTEQHRRLTTSQDRTGCMVSLTLEDRAQFRKEYRPGAFKQWCPWVEE